MNKPAVLFLCSANSARSQMAEALLRHRAKDRVDVFSAGIDPKPIHPLAIQVIEEIGVETTGLQSKGIGGFLGRVSVHTAIIVCEQAKQQCPRIYPFALQTLYWPFEDPAAFQGSHASMVEKFRQIRDHIDARIELWTRDQPPLPQSS